MAFSQKYYYGVDLSHYQKTVDFSKLKQDFIFHKCTQGVKFLDPRYNERKEFLTGAYHFSDGGDAIKECDWFLKNADTTRILILDWEIEHPDPVGWCKKFIDRVKEKTGQDCWLYTNDARALKYAFPKDWKFWIARYADYSGNLYWEYQPKAKWDIWQFTSRGKVDGIEGNVDRNVAKLNLYANSDLTQPSTTLNPNPTELSTTSNPISVVSLINLIKTMDKTLVKRFKSGLWIVLAGTIAQILTMLAENIGMFKFSPTEQAVVVIVLTSVTSQITKYLNNTAK